MELCVNLSYSFLSYLLNLRLSLYLKYCYLSMAKHTFSLQFMSDNNTEKNNTNKETTMEICVLSCRLQPSLKELWCQMHTKSVSAKKGKPRVLEVHKNEIYDFSDCISYTLACCRFTLYSFFVQFIRLAEVFGLLRFNELIWFEWIKFIHCKHRKIKYENKLE